jgi:hypothetical protein
MRERMNDTFPLDRDYVLVAKPRYCPWCGSKVSKHGHDDDCRRPDDPVSLHVGYPQ